MISDHLIADRCTPVAGFHVGQRLQCEIGTDRWLAVGFFVVPCFQGHELIAVFQG